MHPIFHVFLLKKKVGDAVVVWSTLLVVDEVDLN
jgi:hypothetical protein